MARNKKFDSLSADAFRKAESGLKGIDGHGSGYTVDFHGPSVKAPKVSTGAPLSPARQAAVQKAADVSAAKRRAAKPLGRTTKGGGL